MCLSYAEACVLVLVIEDLAGIMRRMGKYKKPCAALSPIFPKPELLQKTLPELENARRSWSSGAEIGVKVKHIIECSLSFILKQF